MSSPLNQRVADEVNQILKLTEYMERPEAGGRLRDEAQLWRAKETTVVVAAEPNRGKSSLLNALLGREVLPVGTDLATTTTHVVVRHGDPEQARVHLVGRAEPIEVPVEDAGAWIVGEAAREGGVRGVELRLDHPLLAAGLALVDTPGVGGLSAAHGRITLSALRRADALMFVVDASAPMSEPELRFLELAAERIDAVAIAVTKVDRYRGWRTVLEDDRTSLVAHAPRFSGAPTFPVSPRLKLIADESRRAGTPDDGLVAESGLPALERFVTEGVVARVALLRLANLLRVADATLGGLAETWQTTLAAASSESGAQDAVAELQGEIERLREHAETSLIVTTDRCNALRERMGVELTRALRELGSAAETKGTAKGERATTADELVGFVEAELSAIDARLSEQIDVEIEQLRAEIEAGVQDPTFAFPRFEGERDSGNFELHAPSEPTATKDPTSTLRVMSAAVATSSGGFLLYTGMADGGTYPLLMGASMLVGALTTVAGLSSSRKQRDLADARRQLAEVIDNARNELSPRLRQRVLELQRATESELKGFLRRRTKELQDAVAEASTLARADAQQREQARATAQERVDLIDRHRQAVAALATEVRGYAAAAAPVAPPPEPG
jgi:GTP-binding protein EngB required for normal cell division